MTGVLRATCHCGAVELELTGAAPLASARRCDCSFCRRRQAANVSVPEDGLTVVRGADSLGLYSFHSHTAQHFFCRTCGIYTHHRRRSNPREFGVNVYCIEGVMPADLEPLGWVDGVNHPKDR